MYKLARAMSALMMQHSAQPIGTSIHPLIHLCATLHPPQKASQSTSVTSRTSMKVEDSRGVFNIESIIMPKSVVEHIKRQEEEG